jgi:hypothetical protein
MISEAKKKVLKFLVDTLNNNKIPFQVSGGLGAIMYGSTRELRDIDIEVNKRNCPAVRELFKDFIVEDFRHYADGEFELWMMTLDINGVSVDINQVEESYVFDRGGDKKLLPEDIIDTESRKVGDIEFPVQNRENLIEYKQMLARDTDLIDVKEMLSNA